MRIRVTRKMLQTELFTSFKLLIGKEGKNHENDAEKLNLFLLGFPRNH